MGEVISGVDDIEVNSVWGTLPAKNHAKLADFLLPKSNDNDSTYDEA